MKDAATVVLLTAEVRTLMIGARQVTLTVWKQLDQVHPNQIIPFGRVAPGRNYDDSPVSYGLRLWVVGKHKESGALVRSSLPISGMRIDSRDKGIGTVDLADLLAEWQALDLIVLAGLR